MESHGRMASEYPFTAAAPPLEPEGPFLPCVSAQMQVLSASLARVAATEAPVLICGETGSGKSTLARQLYEDSPRRGGPLVVVHAPSASVELLEGLARGGDATVLIEEVGELVPSLQDALVRLLSRREPHCQLRFLTTTSRDLNELAQRHGLRMDLLYRLDVVRLDVAPLRQRPEDILFLAEHFLVMAARSFRREVRALAPDARERLLQHRWPGNVRELNNCIVESVLYCSQARLRSADLRIRMPAETSDPEWDLSNALTRLHGARPDNFYRHAQDLLLRWALQTCGGNRLRAAALLGIGRGALRAKLRRYGLDVVRTSAPK